MKVLVKCYSDIGLFSRKNQIEMEGESLVIKRNIQMNILIHSIILNGYQTPITLEQYLLHPH